MTAALYLYGVSRRASGKAPKISSPGIDGVHPVRPLDCDDLLCWVSQVDETEFAGALERNLENLDWLALHGVRHQQAVGEIAARISLIPARFGTLFSGEAALLKDVRQREPALEKVFKRIADADEWGVKVFAVPQQSTPASPQPRSGREYLQQKASRLKKRPAQNDQDFKQLLSALEKIAREAAPTGKVSGAQPNLLWQATFLVPRSRRAKWDQVLKQFVKRWDGQRRIEVNGPWPPYSFVSNAG